MFSPADLRAPLPEGFELFVAVDTGTYMNAAFVTLVDWHAFVVEEFPNYRYVGGEPELTNESTPEWAARVLAAYQRYFPDRSSIRGAWVDPNSQFKQELRRCGIHVRGNPYGLDLRVEISREYANNGRLWFAPWLSIIPYEFEHARWPDEATVGGRFVRIKQHDHGLDCVEHILSRRPRHVSQLAPKKKSFVEQHMERNRPLVIRTGDPHLGML